MSRLLFLTTLRQWRRNYVTKLKESTYIGAPKAHSIIAAKQITTNARPSFQIRRVSILIAPPNVDAVSARETNTTNVALMNFRNPSLGLAMNDNFFTVEYDTSITKVTFRKDQIDVDPEEIQTNDSDKTGVIEAICYTRLAEDDMVRMYSDSEAYWGEMGGQPDSMYFSDIYGVFRQIPAKHRNETDSWDYDPRRRPWFVAAMSGPKDVILVLDRTQGMASTSTTGDKFKAAKDAAKTVIETLTVSDRIAVVSFADNATIVTLDGVDGNNMLIEASDENKKLLKEKINLIEADGVTNFTNAFDEAFTVLSNSLDRAEHSGQGCSIAVIFLTDGAITDLADEDGTITKRLTDEVINLINNRTAELEGTWGKKITIFAYSFGGEPDNNDAEVIKELACAADGIWAHVGDENADDMISVMADYYKLYATGLGAGEDNEDFVAWVEPYIFASDGKLGTTVSVPVFNRTNTPHLPVGVVGVDVYLEDIKRIVNLTDEEVVKWIKNEIIQKDWEDKCPNIEPESCSSRGGKSYESVPYSTCGIQSSTSESVWSNIDCKF
jgi:hypothetical protein